MKKIGILSSHNGSGYQSIAKAFSEGILDAQVVVVISNNSSAKVLEAAASNGTPNFVINNKLFPNENLDEKITELMVEYGCDYIFLSGFMKKIESALLKAFPNKILNSHPALLPNFGGKGMYGRNVHEAVIAAGEKTSGVTIHYVNENYDEGEYVLQASLNISEGESVDSLEDRIKNLESQTIVNAFKHLIEENK